MNILHHKYVLRNIISEQYVAQKFYENFKSQLSKSTLNNEVVMGRCLIKSALLNS